MIQSMTGFGKAETELPNRKITVELKSLNSKQLDVNIRIPNIYKEKEMEIRNLLFQTVERGKVDFMIYIDYVDKSVSTKINGDAVKNYYRQIREISEATGIPMPADSFSTILRLPETIRTDVSELEETEWLAIREIVDIAIRNFTEFRTQEGAALQLFFQSKIEAIASLLKEVDQYEPERIERVRNRLNDAIRKFDPGNFDENRLAQEMIYYLEKMDITEEKTRLDNHLNYFTETMSKEKNPGRKMGFIAQEIGREVNTLGSKASHAELQQIVVRMKDNLEQIKEQVLNVL